MKLAKILSGLFVFMFFIIPIASAIDAAPVLNIDSSYDRTTTTAVITAVAIDVLDNAGMAWIKLYEDGNEIASKQCDSQRSCTLIKPVVKTMPGGIYTYRADAFDRGGHLVSSEDIQVRFAGVDEVDPVYSNIEASPASPAPYGIHSFSVDWNDNGRMGQVFIEHDFYGLPFREEVTERNGDTWTYTLNAVNRLVNLGDYTWRMEGFDVAEQGPNSAITPWQDYEIVRGQPTINWTVAPSDSEDYGVQTTVGCIIGESVNIESELVLERDGAEVSNPDVQTLAPGTYNYTCSAEQTEHYAAVSETRTLTINTLASEVNLLLNTVDGNISGVERLSDAVDIDGSIVTGDGLLDLYIDGARIFDNQTSPIVFNTFFNTTGTHNITLVMPATQNYVASSETHFVDVVDTTAPGTVLGLTDSSVGPGSATLVWDNPIDNDLAGVIVNLDGTDIANYTGVASGQMSNYTITGLNYSTNYTVILYTYDASGNINTAVTADNTVIFQTLPDTNAPVFANVSGPADSVYDSNSTHAFSAEVSDDGTLNTVQLELNSALQNVTGSNGVYSINLSSLAAGNYSWRFIATDMALNSNSTAIQNFTVSRAASACSLSLDKASPISFGENLTVTGSCDNPEAAEVLARNGTDVTAAELNQTFVLSGGEWAYNLSVVQTQNYTSASATAEMNVTKAASDVNLMLNGAHQNITVFVDEQFTVNATLDAGVGNISYYVDSVLDPSSPQLPPLNRISSVASPRVVNLTVVYDETDNYTASSDTLFVTVVPIVYNVSISSSPSTGYTAFDVNATYTITVVNEGNIADNYTLSFTNTDSADFAALSNLTITDLAPGASANVVLTVGDNDTGSYNVTVGVVSDTNASVTDSVIVETNVVDYSTVINSWVDSVYYASGNYTAVQIPELVASRLVDSTVSDSTTLIQVSDVYRSTVTNSNITDSDINDSTITNSNLVNCTVLNSTFIDSASSNCWIEDSYVDPSDTTGSTITGDSSIEDSNVINSTVHNGNIAQSDVYRSTVNDSTVSANSVVADSTITDSVVSNTTVDNSVIEQNSNVADSDVDDSTITNSDVDSSTIETNSVITDSTVTGSTVTDSTIINSTIPSGTDIDSAWIEDGVIVNGTVDGTDYTGNSTNLTDAVNYAPVAGISASATSIKEGESITFTSTSTDANIGGALNDSLSYAWTVNGAPAGNGSTLVRAFSSEGTYVVGLTATDSFSADDTAATTITVSRKRSSGGGSSSSSSSSGPRIITLNITRGSYVTLDLFQGDVVQFDFDGETQQVTVVDININNATLRIQPDTVQLVIPKYATENINLDDDQFNDLSIKVEEIPTANTAKFTFGLREIPVYDPIVIPDIQPEPEAQPEVNDTVVEPEDNATAEPESEELGIWARFVSWLKKIFGIGDEAEVSGNETVALAEPEADEPENSSAITGAAAADAEDEDDSPRAALGIALAVLVMALGISLYFVARKKVLEKRIEKFLM